MKELKKAPYLQRGGYDLSLIPVWTAVWWIEGWYRMLLDSVFEEQLYQHSFPSHFYSTMHFPLVGLLKPIFYIHM